MKLVPEPVQGVLRLPQVDRVGPQVTLVMLGYCDYYTVSYLAYIAVKRIIYMAKKQLALSINLLLNHTFQKIVNVTKLLNNKIHGSLNYLYLAADTVDRSTVVQQPTDLVDIPPRKKKVLKLRKNAL